MRNRFERRTFSGPLIGLSLLAVLMVVPESRSFAQGTTGGVKPATYRSRNFVVHTDLPKKEAEQLMVDLETMLKLISSYWGAPNRKTINCYVVDNLGNWPPGSLHPTGVQSVRGGGGITLSTMQSRGGRVISADSVVYASTNDGTPLHESVHAYCAQTFGRTGPTWYSEGMAEMGAYWRDGDPAVHANPNVIKYLEQSKPKSLNQIINGNETTGDSWENYAWRWALCHLLAHNKNYQARFRPLGLALLNNRPNVTFESVYGSMAREIIFEYLFFLDHLKAGYRVDLCSWDWKTRFRQPKTSRATVSKIEAQAGWQASRALVQEGDTYTFETEGTWNISSDGEAFSSAGNPKGEGKLMGVIFKDYELSEPFAIENGGTWTAPSDGQLFLRCADDWGSLHDNSGEVTVKILKAN